MSWPVKTALLCVFVVGNLGILLWRYSRHEPEIKGVGPFIAALGAAQADTVIAWRNSPSVALDHQAISEFVEQMKWDNCAPPLQKTTTLLRKELSSAEQESLGRTLTSFLEAYSHAEPEQLYNFMTSIGEDIPQSNIEMLRKLLASNKNLSVEDISKLSPHDLWMALAQSIHYDAHWQSLASSSACVTLWRTSHQTSDPLEAVPLGELMAKEFRNETHFHHLFTWQTDSMRDRIVADVRFVVKHDRQLMSEPSAYYVRFVLDPQAVVWHPIEMVHVPTVSGSSPPLLF